MLLQTAWYLYCPWVSATITHLTCTVSDLFPLLSDLSPRCLQIPGISSIFRSSYCVFCMQDAIIFQRSIRSIRDFLKKKVWQVHNYALAHDNSSADPATLSKGVHTHTHTYTIRRDTHTHTYTSTHAHTHAHTHARTHTHKPTYTHTQIHAHTHTNTYKHTHTHTHTKCVGARQHMCFCYILSCVPAGDLSSTPLPYGSWG